jgi:tetratricopeptide (TPR) repeat protein
MRRARRRYLQKNERLQRSWAPTGRRRSRTPRSAERRRGAATTGTRGALLEDALAVLRELGDDLQVGQALCILGIAALLEGEYAEARDPLERSLEIAQRFDYREAAAYSLSGLARVAAGEGDLERAENLLAAADALFDEVGAKRLPLVAEVDGSTRAAVLAARGRESFDAARERTRNTSLEQIVAAALRTPATRT